jgi:hypothetical protein
MSSATIVLEYRSETIALHTQDKSWKSDRSKK